MGKNDYNTSRMYRTVHGLIRWDTYKLRILLLYEINVHFVYFLAYSHFTRSNKDTYF